MQSRTAVRQYILAASPAQHTWRCRPWSSPCCCCCCRSRARCRRCRRCAATRRAGSERHEVKGGQVRILAEAGQLVQRHSLAALPQRVLAHRQPQLLLRPLPHLRQWSRGRVEGGVSCGGTELPVGSVATNTGQASTWHLSRIIEHSIILLHLPRTLRW